MINDRLKFDQMKTSPSFGKKALKRRTVVNTWTRVLEDSEHLPPDWIGHPGVLVGKPPW